MDAHCPRCNRLLMQLSDGPVCAWGCVGWPHWTGATVVQEDVSEYLIPPWPWPKGDAPITFRVTIGKGRSTPDSDLTTIAPLGVRGIDVGAR